MRLQGAHEQRRAAQRGPRHGVPGADPRRHARRAHQVDRCMRRVHAVAAHPAEQERRRSVDLPHELYDVTAWSVGPMAGVDVALCNAAVSGDPLSADAPIAAKAEGSGAFAIAVPWTDSGQARLVTLALRDGIDGRVTDRAFTTQGRTFPRGTVVFPAGANTPEKMTRLAQLAQEVGASSWHITFPTAPEADALAGLGLLRRTGVQFHWSNAGYATFDDFLAALSSSRRKVIKRERREALAGRTVRRLSGYDITEADWDFFFACYQDTGGRKWGSPYLNRAFFSLIGERMGKDIILLIAEDAGRPVAAALNFVGGDCLYGRYWGRVADVAFLHFELCYYQAIEIAIERGLARVEAGAQGEHKLARGYAPVATHSAHWIAHPGLLSAVARYLEAERPAVADEIETLDSFTPFKENLS